MEKIDIIICLKKKKIERISKKIIERLIKVKIINLEY